MRAQIATAISLAFCFAASAADELGSAYLSGNQLYAYCSSNKTAANFYVMGIVDADSNLSNRRLISRRMICPSPAVEAGQMRDIVCKRLMLNPEDRDMSAAYLVRMSLSAVFPCSSL